jgi:hypothetical protein
VQAVAGHSRSYCHRNPTPPERKGALQFSCCLLLVCSAEHNTAPWQRSGAMRVLLDLPVVNPTRENNHPVLLQLVWGLSSYSLLECGGRWQQLWVECRRR